MNEYFAFSDLINEGRHFAESESREQKVETETNNKNNNYLNLKIQTGDFSSGPVDFSVTGPDGPVATNS